MDAQIIQLLWKPIETNQIFVFVSLILICMDVLVGFTNAAVKGEISSSKMRQGLQHKLGSIFLIMAADLVDGALLGGVDLGFTAPVLTATCIYISLMELISVLENCAKLNPELADNPIIGGVTRRLDSVDEPVKTVEVDGVEVEQVDIDYEEGEL